MLNEYIMMKTKVLLVASLLLALFSCTSKQEQKEVPVQSLKHEMLMGDEYLIGRTRDLNLINDSIPVVINAKSENVFQVLHHSQKKVLEIGQVGQGPDDFLMPFGLSAREENAYSFYDLNRRRYSTIHLNEDNDSWQVEHHFKSDTLPHIHIQPIRDSLYLCTGMYKNYRLALLDKHGVFQKGLGEIPYRDEEERKVENMIRSEAYQGVLAVSPSGDKVAHVLMKGDMIYFYHIAENGELELKSEQINAYPDYRYDNGALGRGAPMHHLKARATEEYVYTLYSGRNYEKHKNKAFQSNLIRVYDWHGNLVKNLELDVDVNEIAVTKDNRKIYAIADLPDPVLIAFAL